MIRCKESTRHSALILHIFFSPFCICRKVVPFFVFNQQLHATASLKAANKDGPGVGHSAAANGIMLVLHCHRMLAHCSSTLTLSSVDSHIMAHYIIIRGRFVHWVSQVKEPYKINWSLWNKRLSCDLKLDSWAKYRVVWVSRGQCELPSASWPCLTKSRGYSGRGEWAVVI